jgi:hypothetical protein
VAKFASAFLCASLISIMMTAPIARADSWTRYISEEGGQQAVCPVLQGARGFGCSGRFCDNVALLCTASAYNMWLSGSYWSPYFSEEDDGSGTASETGFYGVRDQSFEHVCFSEGAGGVLTGLRCHGDFCDNLSIQCTQLWHANEAHAPAPASLIDCSWQPAFSEEQGAQEHPGNRVVSGVRCSGSYCDNISLYVCTALDPKLSCQDHCGRFNATGRCWCDSECAQYGDCCRDHFDWCVPQL